MHNLCVIYTHQVNKRGRGVLTGKDLCHLYESESWAPFSSGTIIFATIHTEIKMHRKSLCRETKSQASLFIYTGI